RANPTTGRPSASPCSKTPARNIGTANETMTSPTAIVEITGKTISSLSSRRTDQLALTSSQLLVNASMTSSPSHAYAGDYAGSAAGFQDPLRGGRRAPGRPRGAGPSDSRLRRPTPSLFQYGPRRRPAPARRHRP